MNNGIVVTAQRHKRRWFRVCVLGLSAVEVEWGSAPLLSQPGRPRSPSWFAGAGAGLRRVFPAFQAGVS
jgi:hypothetical protein